MIRRTFFAVLFVVLIFLMICATGCVQSGGDIPPAGSSADSDTSVLKAYGTPQKEEWLVHAWAESYPDNEKLAGLREFMNRTWYPNGPVLGWDVWAVARGDSWTNRIVLYVNAGKLPTEEEMDRIYAEWEKAAAQEGAFSAGNQSRNITGLPLEFEKVTFPNDDALQIRIVQPQEGAVFYGDVVPHTILVDARLLSENGLASAEVRSIFYGENGSTRVVSTPLADYGTRVRVPSISGVTNITVVAVDMKGNVLEKMVNITVKTGMPFGPSP